jgi:hypothetical protein
MKRSKDHSNRNNMKSIVSKVVLASAVAVTFGAVATDSEAGIWDYCADNAENCRNDAQQAKDQCYDQARADARVEDSMDYCTRDEIIQDLYKAQARCDATYSEDMRKCEEEFNGACS